MNLDGSEINISITFTLLDQIKKVAPQVLEDALVKIYQTLVFYEKDMASKNVIRYVGVT